MNYPQFHYHTCIESDMSKALQNLFLDNSILSIYHSLTISATYSHDLLIPTRAVIVTDILPSTIAEQAYIPIEKIIRTSNQFLTEICDLHRTWIDRHSTVRSLLLHYWLQVGGGGDVIATYDKARPLWFNTHRYQTLGWEASVCQIMSINI